MDRETVRLILVVVGVLVLAGIYLWGRYQPSILAWWGRRRQLVSEKLSEAGSLEDSQEDESLRKSQLGSEWLGSEIEDGGVQEWDYSAAAYRDDENPEAFPETMPSLIQVSVIAGPGRYFRGEELKQALLDADLLHGDMGIFHRYDVTFKKPQFSVASLVEPGTFPIDEMESFNCPGIALFFQVARVTDPLAVFDDLINTSRELANQLHGIQWDESRQPLTASKISRLRHLLGRANID